MVDIKEAIAAIEKAIENATPGEWESNGFELFSVCDDGTLGISTDLYEPDAEYIEAVRPTVIAALLEHISKLENERQRLSHWIGYISGSAAMTAHYCEAANSGATSPAIRRE